MSQILSTVLVTTAVLAIGACQKKSEKYSYDLTENQCPTGNHEFNSKDDYCRALRDDAVNNFCALDLRRERYHADCGGDF